MKRKLLPEKQRMKRSVNPMRNSRIRLWWMVVLVVFLFVMGGCGEGTVPSPTASRPKSLPLTKKKEEPTKAAEKKEDKKGEEEYSYNPAGKPDPFKPFVQLTAAKGGTRNAPLTPLQKYDVSQLKLVAIISSPGGNIALVEDVTGKGYFLKKGTWIGKNDGKVTKILKDKVIIEEVFQDIFGQTKTNEISISLHKAEEGGES